MPFITLGRKRFALPLGETRIGGRGEGALPFPELAGLAAAAVLFVTPDDAVSLWPQRDGSVPVTVNGSRLGSTPAALRHGTKIEVAGVRLLFGDLREAGTTTRVAVIGAEERVLLAADGPEEPTANTGGRLVARGTGEVIAVPDIGLVIGRDPDSDVVIPGRDVSRRHAVVRQSVQGYVLSDISTNGTYINHERVDGVRVLGMGDVIRISDDEFRFEADPPTLQPTLQLRADAIAALRTHAPITPPAPPPSREPPTAPRPDANLLLATLEIVNDGTLAGTRFRLERPVVHVGRGLHNDVRLGDNTVSGSHATLTRHGPLWIIVDHESTNGTYVEGRRIAGAREFSGVAELRFGNVKMVFRPSPAASGREPASQPAVDRSPRGGEGVVGAPGTSGVREAPGGLQGRLGIIWRLWKRYTARRG